MRGIKKEWLMGALACASALLFSGVAHAQATGISITKHNLGSSSPAGQNRVVDTAEVCVFCHTPHGADTTVTGAPLWNKRLPATGGYNVYNTANSTTIDGQVLPGVGSVSITCLSCHDGTQAMDNIINAPGSGGYDATGGGANGLAYNWGTSPRIQAGGAGIMNGVAMLGTDLRDDHPIGIEYCGGGLSGTAPLATPGLATGNCKDADFEPARSGTINGQGVWWVDTGTVDNTRTRTDMILFTRAFTGGAGPAVECASCHDPHVSAGQAGPNNQVAGATFLRVSNAGSAVCLTCHTK